MSRPALLLATAALLTACQEPAPAPPQPRTVLAFLEDAPALEQAWTACRNDPGGLGRTPDCVNAGYAKERLMMLGRERAIAGLKGKE